MKVFRRLQTVILLSVLSLLAVARAIWPDPRSWVSSQMSVTQIIAVLIPCCLLLAATMAYRKRLFVRIETRSKGGTHVPISAWLPMGLLTAGFGVVGIGAFLALERLVIRLSPSSPSVATWYYVLEGAIVLTIVYDTIRWLRGKEE